ncbi:transposase [Escherichia coli]|nr:transposase [Escherichia coli]
MTKTVSTSKKPRKQHSPEFRSEALKLAERIGVTAAARELSLYESQLYNWRSNSKISRRLLNVNWRCLPRLHVSNASWQNGMKSWLSSKRPRHTSRSA